MFEGIQSRRNSKGLKLLENDDQIINVDEDDDIEVILPEDGDEEEVMNEDE